MKRWCAGSRKASSLAGAMSRERYRGVSGRQRRRRAPGGRGGGRARSAQRALWHPTPRRRSQPWSCGSGRPFGSRRVSQRRMSCVGRRRGALTALRPPPPHALRPRRARARGPERQRCRALRQSVEALVPSWGRERRIRVFKCHRHGSARARAALPFALAVEVLASAEEPTGRETCVLRSTRTACAQP